MALTWTLLVRALSWPTTICASSPGRRLCRSAILLSFKTINARGRLSYQQVSLDAVYNGTSNLGTVIISVPLYIGTTEVGRFIRRIHRDANNELAGNVQYVATSGHSNINAAAISDACHLFKIGTGAALTPRSTAGHLDVFDEEVPAAEGYANRDVGVVEIGVERGVWTKDSARAFGAADTGWAGKSYLCRPSCQPPAGGRGRSRRGYLSPLALGGGGLC